MFTITACMSAGQIGAVDAHQRCVTLDVAEHLASRFPRFIRVKASTLSGDPNHQALVTFSVYLNADDCNKGKNEAGLRRLRAFCRVAPWQYDANAFGNSAPREMFDALLREEA